MLLKRKTGLSHMNRLSFWETSDDDYEDAISRSEEGVNQSIVVFDHHDFVDFQTLFSPKSYPDPMNIPWYVINERTA